VSAILAVAFVGLVGAGLGYWIGTNNSSPTIGAALSPTINTPTIQATPVPSPTMSSALSEFLRDYVYARSKYWDELFAIFPPITDRPELWATYYGQRGGVHIRTHSDLERLPRSAETRNFVETAVRAAEVGLSADMLLGDAYTTRGGPSASEQSRWFALRQDAERTWRLLDDQIEDALRRYGSSWPAGGRPEVPH
jgi:hypothetical protein